MNRRRVGIISLTHDSGMINYLLLPIDNQALGFFVSQERTLNTLRATSISWQVEHIATTKQALSATHIDNCTRVDGGTDHKRDTCWNVCLDQASDYVNGRTLCGDHEMNACCTGQLSQATDHT